MISINLLSDFIFNVFKVTDGIVKSNVETDKLYVENKNYKSY